MAKTLAIVFGIVFVIVGILGFMGSPIAGPMGLFQTNALHDLVHLLFGVILLFVAFRSPMKSAMWLKILGIIYLVLAVLGFLLIPGGGALLGLVQMNANDHWLHLFLGVVLVIAGMMGKSSSMSSGMPMSSPSM